MNFQSFQTSVNLKKLFYYKIKIYSEGIGQQSQEDDEEDQQKSYINFDQIECKEVNIGYYELLKKQKHPNYNKSKADDNSDKFDFNDKFRQDYLKNHQSKLEDKHYLQGVIQFKVEEANNNKECNVILEDDQLFYCQNDNLDYLFKKIKKSYEKIVDIYDDKEKDEAFQRDIQKLDRMKQFNKGSYSYFVIEKLQFKQYKKQIENTEYRYQIKSSESTDVKQKKFIILASSDQQFKQHLHLLHKQDKLSAYSIQKTIEQRMDTIIYRSFKDIIRMCYYGKLNYEQTYEKYGDFYDILTSKKRGINDSFFKMKDETRITLKEIKSIVYKNACIEGIFPFNIYLNTFQEGFFWKKAKLLVGKILSDNSYKLTHHLSTQVGNIFYSYNDSNVFSIFKMQQKERSVSKSNEFTKIRVLDFFPLNQQIDEISDYIFNRLDYFDGQLMYFFSSFPDASMVQQCKDLLEKVEDIKQVLGLDGESIHIEQKFEQLVELLSHIEDILKDILYKRINSLNLVNNSEYYRNLEDVSEILSQLKQCIQGYEKLENIPQENQIALQKIASENQNYDENYEDIREFINALYKIFLKYILTNYQVKSFQYPDQFSRIQDSDNEEEMEERKEQINEEKEESSASSSIHYQQYYNYNQQGDASVYTLLLRRLGYYFLSHYYGQFKYFHSWPIIITDVEFQKYQLLINNCQTSGISFAYQIKELLKEFIEPLFIPEKNQFFDYYDNYFKSLNEGKQPLSYKFKPTLDKKVNTQKVTQSENIKNEIIGSKESRESVIKYYEKSNAEKMAHERSERVDSIDMSIKSSKQTQNKQQVSSQQLVLDSKYKEFYFKSLIKSFQKYSSKINSILNQSIKPLILEKPLPYHQFYGENMVYEYMNAIISKDDLILQVYKIIVQDFPENIEKIKQVCFNILGNDIVDKNLAFQVIVNEALNQVYDKPSAQRNTQFQNTELPQDFLSTLFIIYDALYFMRNKSLIETQNSATAAKSASAQQQNNYLEDKDDNNNSSFYNKKPISSQRIIDYQKKKYFNSYTRHEYKDFFKELAFYYFNSIRMKHSTFTSRDSLSYLGFLLIKDPEKRYKV